MYRRRVIFGILIFILGYTFIYFILRFADFRFVRMTVEDLKSVSFIYYYAMALIFSIISGFIIQMQWHKWNTLVDSIRGEVSMLRHLYMTAHHFPFKEKNMIRDRIYDYLVSYIKDSEANPNKAARSRSIDEALNRLEDTVYDVSSKHHEAGNLAFSLLSRTRDYRETKIQIGLHNLPFALRLYVIFASCCLVSMLFFIAYNAILFDYFFTLTIALLVYGIYALIDDFDHPYRSSNWRQTLDVYRELYNEIVEKNRTRASQ